MLIRRLGGLCIGAIAALTVVSASVADPITITLTTPTPLAGTDAILAFDLTNGGSLSSNSVTIGAVATDGTIGGPGTAYFTHDLVLFDTTAPTLASPVTFSDTDFFTEYGQAITLGSSLSFTIDTTGNGDVPAPDELDFFLLDSTGSASLVTTTDSFNALFRYTLGDTNQPVLFDITDIEGMTIAKGPATLPEPSTLVLLAAAILGAVVPIMRVPR